MNRKHLWHGTSVVILMTFLLSGALAPALAAPPAQGDAPIELTYGQTIDGQLGGEQPSMFFAFDAQQNEVVTITMIVVDGDLDPFIVLNDPAGTLLATDDNSGGGMNARLTFVIPVEGRYTIQATQAGGLLPETGGAFSLNLTAAVDQDSANGEAGAFIEPTPEYLEAGAVAGASPRLLSLTAPSTVRDSLDRQTAFRMYWFEGRAGDQVSVAPDQFADFWPLLVLTDGGFVEQIRAEPGTGLRHTLAEDGVYFLFASLPDSGNVGGAYGFSFGLAGQVADNATHPQIEYDQMVNGGIDDENASMTYRFEGKVGDTVTATMRRVDGDLDSYLYLLDGTGALLFEDNDSGGQNGDAQIVFTLPVEGEYLILATRLGQNQGTTSGSFMLELQTDALSTAIQEGPGEPVLPTDYAGLPQIMYGETVEGELSDAQFMDIYVFAGSAGDEITIDLESLNQDETNGLDPLVLLLDDARIPLIENDDIEAGVVRDARIEYTLPKAGYYAIVATRFDQDAGITTGPYQLTLSEADQEGEDVPMVDQPILLDAIEPAELEPGTPTQGVFDTTAALYSFFAGSGSLVDVSATTDEGSDAVVILADADLQEIVSSAGPLTGVTLSETGRYLVIVAPRFGPASSLGNGYILAFTQTSMLASEEGGPAGGSGYLVYGATVNGVIDEDTTSQIYQFDGLAGERVRILMEASPGSSLDCYLELQTEDGTLIDANDDIDPGVIRDSRISVELPSDGVYTIIASRYVGDDAKPTTGAYRLSLEQGTDGDPDRMTDGAMMPIGYGETLNGEITDDQYLLFYVFDGTAGDTVTISLEHTSGNLDSVLYLYQSVADGWIQIASNDDSPLGGTYAALLDRIVLPQSSKYLIGVARYGLEQESTTGTFTVTLSLEP